MALKEFGEFSMQRDLAFFGSFRKESEIRFGGLTNRVQLRTHVAPEQVHHCLFAKTLVNKKVANIASSE